MTQQTVTIFGGSGFLGRYIARRFAKDGWFVRVAVRRPNEAGFVRTYGRVGQVEPIQANLRDEASVVRAVEGADLVINATGILREDKFQKYDGLIHQGSALLARVSKEADVAKFVQISAIGADADSESQYAQSKANGEAAVLAQYKDALIVRPSVMFGVEDDFFNRFGAMMRLFPVMPVPFSKTKIQPVYVDDVAQFVQTANAKGLKGVYDLGGPTAYSMMELMNFVKGATMRKRLLVPMPNFMTKVMARSFQILEFLTLGLVRNPFMTPDNAKMLACDNVVTGKNGFDATNIQPTAMEPIAERYLESFRAHGEFETLVKPKI